MVLGNLIGLTFLLVGIAFVVIICETFIPTKSRRYRKELADLYVAGRTKQIAK